MKRGSADFGAFVPGPRCVMAPTGHGRLDGLTFAVKDLIDVAGVPTGGGNPDWLHEQKPAEKSARVVGALLDEGARLIGKTITDELAFSLEGANAHYGSPINPSCPERLAGGSSSGSAAAVAGGLVDFALGTDTGGSVRVPASFCGIWGFRPSHGRVSTAGVLGFAPSYDTIGWFARDAATLATVGEVLLGPDSAPEIKGFVIAKDTFALTEPAVETALLARCKALGIKQKITLFDGDADAWLACYRVLQGAEIHAQFGAWIARAKPRFGEAIAARFADAATITAAEVERYRPLRAMFAARVNAVLREHGAILIPSAPCSALKRDSEPDIVSEFYRRALTLTSIAGHTGAPQIAVPAVKVDGCPVGLSIVGPVGSDCALIDAARRLAAHTTMHRCHAPMTAECAP